MLKSMLNASAARAKLAAKRRRPVLVAGAKVRVISGPFRDEEGVVDDADYIESRVLVSLPSKPEPQWIDFKHIGPCL